MVLVCKLPCCFHPSNSAKSDTSSPSNRAFLCCLPQYFISDITDEDVVCPYDETEQKYVLADDFTCYDYGEIIGKVSKSTIKKLRRSN